MTTRTTLTRGLVIVAAVAAVTGPLGADAAISFQVSFVDPGSAYASFYDRIRSNVVSAGNEWAGYFNSSTSASLQVQFSFADIATASGASVTNSYLGVRSGLATYEQGAAYEIRTGIDPNGSAPDIQMTLGRNGYLQNELWFDPSPARQTAVVPANRTDARSVFLHEFGHAFAFNGWRDGLTGALPGGYQSSFDALVTNGIVAGGPQLFFTGSSAVSLYGGPVPLTFGNYGHVGSASPRPGANLIPWDLMNGVAFSRGTRYHVSALDFAFLGDVGLPVKPQGAGLLAQDPIAAAVPFATSVPEPPVYVLALSGLLALSMMRKRACRNAAHRAFNRHAASETPTRP